MKKEQAKQQVIKKQITAKHFTAIIGKDKYIVEADKPLKDKLALKIEAYNKKNSEAKLKELINLLTPKTTKAKTDLVVAKKKLKHDKKQVKAELKATEADNAKLTEALTRIEQLEKTNKEQADELATLRQAKDQKVEEKKEIVAPVAQRRSGEY